MMKSLLLSSALICSLFSLSQNAPIDFETSGNGASWTWTTFENDTNPPLEIIANPDPTGINTSSTVAKFTALQTGMPFAGCESMHGSDLGSFSFNANNSTLKIMVWKSVISDVGLKFVEASGDAQPEVKVANTLINQWEELSFDLSGSIGVGATGIIDQIVIFPDFDNAGRAQDNIVYFDNITFGTQTVTPVPMGPAPTPTLAASDVISMFSDPYTDVPVDTWNTPWSAATLEDIMISGNPTKKYTNLDFNGTETVASTIDATTAGMLYFHMDVWSPNSTTFRIKLVDFGMDGFGNGNDTEFEIPFTIAQEQWVSLDIPLTDFTGMNQTDIAQLIISSLPAGGSIVYVDNVYFSKVPTVGFDDVNQITFTAYPNPTTSVWNINSNDTIESVQVFNALGVMVYSDHTIENDATSIDASVLPLGMYFAKAETANSTQIIKLIKD